MIGVGTCQARTPVRALVTEAPSPRPSCKRSSGGGGCDDHLSSSASNDRAYCQPCSTSPEDESYPAAIQTTEVRALFLRASGRSTVGASATAAASLQHRLRCRCCLQCRLRGCVWMGSSAVGGSSCGPSSRCSRMQYEYEYEACRAESVLEGSHHPAARACVLCDLELEVLVAWSSANVCSGLCLRVHLKNSSVACRRSWLKFEVGVETLVLMQNDGDGGMQSKRLVGAASGDDLKGWDGAEGFDVAALHRSAS